jgi:hypothetical protein
MINENKMQNVLNSEILYMGEFRDYADQLLDNIDDIKDVFDEYLAIKLYNWRLKWFSDHYEEETDEHSREDISFNCVPYNLCMNWEKVLHEYYNKNETPINLPSNKEYSDICRSKIENTGIVYFYFKSKIPFPSDFLYMLNTNSSSKEEGEQSLIDNLTPSQLEEFRRYTQECFE